MLVCLVGFRVCLFFIRITFICVLSSFAIILTRKRELVAF